VAELNIDQSVSSIRVFSQTSQSTPVNIFPNPFNAVTNIRFILRQAEHVRVRIVDVRGRELIRLYDNFMAAGAHEFSWNGKNASGSDVASGMYLISFETGRDIVSKRLFYVR
jgi:flagellar hook assembly protein FlgD